MSTVLDQYRLKKDYNVVKVLHYDSLDTGVGRDVLYGINSQSIITYHQQGNNIVPCPVHD